MKQIFAFIFCLICFPSLSKDKKVLTLDDHKTNFISFEIDYGGRFGKTALNTGFYAENGSPVTFYPGSGIQGQLSVNYFHGLRWTYGVSYSIQSGSLNKVYDNGSGSNTVQIITPIIRYAPLLYHKNKCKVNIGIGLDAVISNSLEVNVKLPGELKTEYYFKKSFGPTVLLEYQAALSKHMGFRFGVSGHHLKSELTSFKFNNEVYDADYESSHIMKYSVINPNVYIGLYVFL